MKVFRQGDVAFVKIDPIVKPPEKAKILKTRVIRKGENGGLHQLEKKEDVVFYEMKDERGETKRFVISPDGVGILHGEHAKVELPPGHYEVRVQREARGNSWGYVRD